MRAEWQHADGTSDVRSCELLRGNGNSANRSNKRDQHLIALESRPWELLLDLRRDPLDLACIHGAVDQITYADERKSVGYVASWLQHTVGGTPLVVQQVADPC